MTLHVKLQDVIEGLESQSFESYSFLDKRTGEVVLISEEKMRAAEDNEPLEEFPEWEQELVKIAKEVDKADDHIQLPTKFDIDEYSIMEKFCLSIEDAEKNEVFCHLIKGSDAFQRFKNAIHEYDIADQWYNYRNDALKQIAIKWCEENDIEVVDK